MALTVPNNINFYWATLVVFAVDVVWLSFVYNSNNELFQQIKWWLILNFVAVILILIFIAWTGLEERLRFIILAILLFLRTILDYKFTWSFYWPGLSSNKEEL